jgi:micrococcal nuclease
MDNSLFVYKATVTDVPDGSNIVVDADLGFGIRRSDLTLRIAGVSPPPVCGPSKNIGVVSRNFVRDLLLNKRVVIRTHADCIGGSSNYSAEVFVEISAKTFQSLETSEVLSAIATRDGCYYLSIEKHLVENGFSNC